MDKETERFVLDLLAGHYILTLATNREDGWPQATTVGYVNDGLALYVMTFPQAQKVANIRRDPRVSLTVDREEPDWNRLKGLSMAATAEIVDDPAEIQRAGGLMIAKFPQIKDMPQPDPADVTVLRITPKIISVLNYEKGFGHTELVQA
jgi:PPOX class probable F420-dependent enzyme